MFTFSFLINIKVFNCLSFYLDLEINSHIQKGISSSKCVPIAWCSSPQASVTTCNQQSTNAEVWYIFAGPSTPSYIDGVIDHELDELNLNVE